MKNYVVVAVINRETYCSFAETLEQAKEIMESTIKDILEQCNADEQELLELQDMDKGETFAWITYDDMDFNINIVAIE